MASGNVFSFPLCFLILQLTFHFPFSVCSFPFSANLRNSDTKNVLMVPPGEAKEHMGHPRYPTQGPIPRFCQGRNPIYGDKGFLLAALGPTITSNLEMAQELAADCWGCEKGVFQVRRPRQVVSEAPKCLHAIDSQRWSGVREVGGGRGPWPPPEGLSQTGLELTPGPDQDTRHGKGQLEKQKAGSRSS